jgi:glycosyltransferase involved in cell wall biosynthesis
MKLLLFTQVLDRNDPTLSAYHRLVAGIARNFESVVVICLKKGDFDLPQNTKVLSLGKEDGESRVKYVKNLFAYVCRERKNYDAVFVHMNQEYILIAGLLWKFMGKKIYMWRNHHAGSILTDIAASFCEKVFCTSRFSYTAKYKKTVFMPVGIDMSWFSNVPEIKREPASILFLGRIAPVKKPDILIRALGELARKGIEFTATFIGDPLPKDEEYARSLRVIAKEEGIEGLIIFLSGIPNDKTREAYSRHELFVNLSSSGMYDKTIFEAMACGCLVLATNKNLEGSIDPMFIAREGDVLDIAAKLCAMLSMSEGDVRIQVEKLKRYVAQNHSLHSLSERLSDIIGRS